MDENKVQIKQDTLKKLLEIQIDSTELLEKIPKEQDENRLSQISQHIGAELEAIVRTMNEAEKQDPVIKDLIEEIENNKQKQKTDLETLEKEVLS